MSKTILFYLTIIILDPSNKPRNGVCPCLCISLFVIELVT